MSTLLGIDYGLARIGLAIARVGLAEPLFVLENDLTADIKLIGPQALSKIQALLIEEQIEEIIVGISEARMAEKTHAFVAELKKHTPLPIKLVDETLSSYEVEEKLKDLPKKHRIGPIDHYAAALILENYLELC